MLGVIVTVDCAVIVYLSNDCSAICEEFNVGCFGCIFGNIRAAG